MLKASKRILLVTSEFPPLPGGIGNHAHNLAKHLTLEGYKLSVLTDQRSTDIQQDLVFDAKQKYKVYRTVKTQLRFPMYIKRLYRLFILSKDVDVILASGKFSLWIVAWLSLFRKKSTLAIIHGTEVNFRVWWLKLLINFSLKRFDHVVAVSNFTKQLVAPLKLASVKVIANGYDDAKWKSKISPVFLEGTPRLITIGHVSERKGQKNVIALLPELLKHYPQLHYHCFGIPTEVHRFKAFARKLGVLSHITFHGCVDNETLQGNLVEADVCVLLSSETSTGDVEGFGIVLLEANILGIPVIAAKGSGVEDAVAHGKSGFLVQFDSSREFRDALKEILDKKDFFSQQAKLWAKKFKWELIIKQYIEVLEKNS